MGKLHDIRRRHRQAAALEMALAIRAALEEHGWSLAAAARSLGEDPRNLQRVIAEEGMGPLLAEHGVRRGRPRGSLGRRRLREIARQSGSTGTAGVRPGK